MISGIDIRGFKAWKKTGALDLRPLTIFFGTNSSGKSSLNQLLLLLKQTVESPDRKRVIHFGDRNSAVDVGTYEDMVFGHDSSIPLEVAITWDLPETLVVKDTRTSSTVSGQALKFAVRILQEEARSGRVIVENFRYKLLHNQESVMAVDMQRESKGKYRLAFDGYKDVRSQGRVWPLPPPVRFYGFPDEAVAYYENTGFLPDFTLRFEQLLGSISYLGPLRDRPLRTYVWSGEIPADVGWSGERVVEAMLAGSERMISKGYKRKNRSLQTVVASWLSEMNLIKHFQVERIAENRKEYEVKVRVNPRSPEVTLPDVGFGISQVLPVIVQCFYCAPGSIVVIEQPEIHLHPSVQAKLADLFVEAISAREGGKDRGIQLLIESHSEHFLRRLQRLIAEEQLDPSKVAVYFCDEGPQGSTIRQLELDMFGRIANWPPHFFGDMLDDVAGQTRSTISRMKKNA